MSTVISAITFCDVKFLLVVIRAEVVVIVIAGRVIERRERIGFPLRNHLRVHFLSESRNVIRIGVCTVIFKEKLILVIQTVKTKVLLLTCTCLVGESAYRGRCFRHASPNGVLRLISLIVFAYRKAILKGFLSVFENIFAHVAKVDIEVATFPIRVGVGETRIHNPKLYIFYIGFLEIGVVNLSHDTAPTLLGVSELTIGINLICADIIRSAFGRVEREIEE